MRPAGKCSIEHPTIKKRILQQIEALRKELAGADRQDQNSFALVFHAFFDLAQQPAFFDVSKPAPAGLSEDGVELKAVLLMLAQNLVGDAKASIEGLRVFRIGDAGLLHGGFFARPFMGTFFYFETDRRGLVAFTQGELTCFSRITMTRVPDGAAPVRGPKGVQ